MTLMVGDPLLSQPMRELVAHLIEQLRLGSSFNNPRLTEAANKCFGGSRGAGRYTPRDAYDAMEAAANLVLLEDHAAELMHSPVADALPFLRAFASRLPTQADRTDEQVELQQFSSPLPLAFIAARLLSPQPSELIVEPSAGTASLAIWPCADGARVVCNEISERRRGLLALLGFETFAYDAEVLDDLMPVEIKPVGILMNPPFSSTAGRVRRHDTIYGARHIETALRRLERGGRLVAISTAAMAMPASKFSQWWQSIARRYNVRANYTIGGREFARQGTGVDVQIIVIDKDSETPGDDWRSQLEHINWSKADSLEEAWEALKHMTKREPREEASEEEPPSDMFVPYEVTRLTGGHAHPAPIVESASMAAVKPPVITYRPALPVRVVEEGLLSDLQMESVCYAGQRHEQRLLNGARAGFFVGHGTGVGKGRILAAIIADNWNQGRRRALWLSVNNDLIEATRRDLRDLGLGHIQIVRINEYSPAADIEAPFGVVFSSYASLIAESRDGKRRIDQIQRWLGREALIICDEAHKAKNALAGGYGEPTQTGQAVIGLQSAERNPDYRVVYSSATGATDVRHMAYMTRLGLWGPGTPFSTFNQFMVEIEGGGVGAMEMVSRDMKARGMLASGSISYGVCPNSGLAVEYREVIHRLTPEQREMYDGAAAAWQLVMRSIDEALAVTRGGKLARSQAIKKFCGDQQRFFRQVLCAFKVPTVIAETERAIAEGKAVVISLVGTGEARTREQVARAVASNGSLDDLDFTPREVICQMVERGFPTTLYQDVTDPATGKTYQEPVKDKHGNIVQSRDALEMKQDLLDRLSSLNLPENPLDQLLNHFGEDKVAELTGRTRRLIRDSHTNKTVYKKRAPEGVAMDRVNVHEMNEFQEGRKLIAIISDAASLGISLHASNRAANRRRRVHLTLETGWSADKQMQTFGRSHRSDQAMPPEYGLIAIDVKGERRFISTIAKRLASLGALTKGERRAADANELSRYNFETEEGRAALGSMFKSIMRGEDVPGLEDPLQTLRDMGLLTKDALGREVIRKEDEGNVPRFLNRVLALDVDRQNAIFDHFAELFDRAVLTAKETGTFDEGVTDVRALAVRMAQPPRVVAVDDTTDAKTMHYLLDVDRSTRAVSFEAANTERERGGGAFYLHTKRGEVILSVPSRSHTDPDTGRTYQTFAIWKPEKARADHWKDSELFRKCRRIEPEEAREWWEKRHAALPAIETTQMHIIGGAILPLWQRLKSQDNARLRVVRVTTTSGQRIVGATIPQSGLGPTLRALGIKRRLIAPADIYAAVWLDNDRIELGEKLLLRRTTVRNEPRIEVCGPTYFQYATLRACGLISEYIQYKPRFFISTEEMNGIAMLTKVLEAFPPTEPTNDDAEVIPDDPIEVADEPPANIIDLLLPTPEAQEKPKPTEDKAPSLRAHPSNGGIIPAGQRPMTKSRKHTPRANDQLAYNFNQATSPEAILEALSAIISKVAAKRR